jgi:hypothetical protein
MKDDLKSNESIIDKTKSLNTCKNLDIVLISVTDLIIKYSLIINLMKMVSAD